MKLAELKQINKEDFYSSLVNIDTWEKERIEMFFQKQVERFGLFGCYPYLLNYFYNENATKKCKYVVIEVDDDEVILFFKRVSMFTAQYWRLVYYPISLNDVRKNEEKVLRSIIEKGLIKQVHYIEQDRAKIDKIVKGGEKHIDYDFFADLEKREKEVEKARFRSKHAINLCKGSDKFYCRVAKDQDKEKILALYKFWKENHEWKVKEGILNSFWKNFEDNVDNENLIFLVYGYGNFLLGFSVFVRVMDNFCYKMIEQSQRSNMVMTRCKDEAKEDRILKRILQEMGEIMFYFSLKELIGAGIEAIYCAGSQDNDKGLLSFKRRLLGNNIDYYRKVVEGS